jgi:hypothetical protein
MAYGILYLFIKIYCINLKGVFGKKAFQDSFSDSHFDIFDNFKNVNFIKRPPEFAKKRGCD